MRINYNYANFMRAIRGLYNPIEVSRRFNKLLGNVLSALKYRITRILIFASIKHLRTLRWLINSQQ